MSVWRRCRLVAVILVVLLVGGGSAWAQEVNLRRLVTDDLGNTTVIFSVLDAAQEPLVDPIQVPLSGLAVSVGESPEALSVIELGAPTLTTMRELAAPIRIVVLLPNCDLFNGLEGDALRPDQMGVRAALGAALETLPQSADIRIQVGMYNDAVVWLPEFNTTQMAELREALVRPEYVAPPGTRVEDPFNAVDVAYRTKLRRQARLTTDNALVTYLVIVTSALTQVSTIETFSEETRRLRSLLSDRDMFDVVTQVIGYNPLYPPELLSDPEAEVMRFATELTPESGSWRITGTVEGIRSAFSQTINEISSAMVLQFNSAPVTTDATRAFQLVVTPVGGTALESNIIHSYIP